MAGLVDMLRQIEAAEAQARDLRKAFGPLAEEQCRRALAGLSKNDANRSRLLDVLRALPWVPLDKDAPLQ
jgi:hypothetical protein